MRAGVCVCAGVYVQCACVCAVVFIFIQMQRIWIWVETKFQQRACLCLFSFSCNLIFTICIYKRYININTQPATRSFAEGYAVLLCPLSLSSWRNDQEERWTWAYEMAREWACDLAWACACVLRSDMGGGGAWHKHKNKKWLMLVWTMVWDVACICTRAACERK